MNKEVFSEYAKGYHSTMRKKLKSSNKMFRKGAEDKVRHSSFCKGSLDAFERRTRAQTNAEYCLGYACPDYTRWSREGVSSWTVPMKVRKKMSLRDGRPYRTGITAFYTSAITRKRMVLVGQTRKGQWSLIGGKAKRNEPILSCAQREFEEETKHMFHDHASSMSVVDCVDFDKHHTLFLVSVPKIDLQRFKTIVGNIHEQEFQDLQWVEWSKLERGALPTLDHVQGDLAVWKDRGHCSAGRSVKQIIGLKHSPSKK